MRQWKKWILTLSFLGMANVNAYALDSDKTKHIAAGTAIYGICVGIGHLTETAWLNYKTCLIPVGIAAIGKEMYDANSDGNADWADAGATMVVPAVIAGLTYTLYEW